jgi:hypothetical protein
MPEMDLGDIASLDLTKECEMSGALGDAGFRLMAYLTWPRDESRRRQFLVATAASALGEIEGKPPEAYDEIGDVYAGNAEWQQLRSDAMAMIADKHFRAHGGYSTVAGAPGFETLNEEIVAKSKQTLAVGELLHTVRCIAQFHREVAGGASVNKAVKVMGARADVPGALRNRAGLMEAWSEFKPVAHVCAALTEAYDHVGERAKAMSEDEPFFGRLGWTLAVARDYQEFMTTFIPHGRREGLVLVEESWTIPAGLTLPNVQIGTGVLSPKAIEALRNYKAPKRP